MIDVRIDSIIYQSQVYYTNLVNTLADKRRVGKALDSLWEKADTILGYLEALNFRDYLTDEDDINNVNYILERLIVLCELNYYPQSAPIEFQPPPAILVGVKGDPGDSVIGPVGPAGLATDFQDSLITSPEVIDSFDITDAKGARWDYIVRKSTGEQRAGQVIGSWKDDGSALEMVDSSTEDIQGSTSELTFDIQYVAGDIQLVATPASGTWTVIGTRYFIPNNGNGSGPISDALADGTIFIGNSGNLAQSRSVSGVLTITNTGVTSFVAQSIVNADINNSAAIALSKLATVTADRLLLSNGAGQIIASTVTATEVGFLSGLSSNAQSQLNARLIDPMTTIGDIIIRNGVNITTRLGAGANGTVLQISGGIPVWAAVPGGISGLTTNYLPKASSATTLANSIISEGTGAITIAGTTELQGGYRTEASGPYLKMKVIDIGDWDMDTNASVAVAHGLTVGNIRSVTGHIRNDNANNYFTIGSDGSILTETDLYFRKDNANSGYLTGTNVVINRKTGGFFDNTSFNSTGFNRGWITIIYEA